MPTASQTGSLVLGGATLIGGLIVGKVAADWIQGDEVREPGERSAFDESVRLVASLIGISVTLLQLPAAYAEVQKLMAGEAAPAPLPPPAQ